MEYDAPANAHRFAPAAPDEEFVFGACSPGWHSAASSDRAFEDWLSFVRDRDVRRVCCLVPGRHLERPDGTVSRYRREFGPERVRHAPLCDRRLVDETVLKETVLPFLRDSADARERVVVHCLAGLDRTGQVLAAWLAYDRGYGPERAIDTVERMGRKADVPVESGHATEAQLHGVLRSVRRDK